MSHGSRSAHDTVVALWGAGTGSTNWLQRYREQEVRYLVVDRDVQVQGQSHSGCPVIAPEALASLDVAKLVVTVSDVAGPLAFLASIAFDAKRIVVPPKADLSADAFADRASSRSALEWISRFMQDAEKARCEPMVEFGTLLGLVRDNTLIPWDNDLDISFPFEQRPRVVQFATAWAARNTGLVPPQADGTGTAESMVIAHVGANFFLDLNFRWNDSDDVSTSSCQIHGSGRIGTSVLYPRTPLRGDWPLMAPQDPQAYLEAIYGPTWRTPDRSFSFSDYSPDDDAGSNDEK